LKRTLYLLAAGICAVLLFVGAAGADAPPLGSACLGFRSCPLLFSLGAAVVSLADEVLARRDFPTLADFQTPFELERWGGQFPAPGCR